MNIELSRQKLATCVALVLAGIAFSAWWVQPDRSLERIWTGLINAVESRNPSGIRDRLARDYSDRWGYDRESLTRDARLAFFHFRELELRVQDVVIARDGDRATITAIIRLHAAGSDEVADARLTVNSIFTPYTFEWERNKRFPWSWKLKSFDHSELELNRFRTGSYLSY
jgi:hypothetical protein